ncbi:MAG TPA: twitching motility protein PilT [Planctomycetales bacterium]|jgi:predicted nucleic acid-binding protein|nr:twitching motility protein PilT [Planctomycetales bacterium]
MSRLVIDSSVLVKWFVLEPYSAEARRILAGYQTGAIDLLAPDLLPAELGNILWKKHLFQGLALADAELFLTGFPRFGISLVSSTGLLDDAFRLAVSHRRSVYDALYIALSVRENCPFVTADEKLIRAVGATFPNIVPLAGWP